MRPSKIVCIGWNYKRHITETDSSLPDFPTVFLKPISCLIGDGEDIVIPPGITNVQHEVELALIIGKKCKNVSEEDALKYISHAAVFNDITARSLQTAARKDGNPWSLSKGMDTFGPLSDCVPIDNLNLSSLRLRLYVNGNLRQDGNTKDMIFSIPFIISYLSKYMTLEPGDIIATGTPEGVSEIKKGDLVTAMIDRVGKVTNRVV